MGDSSMSAIFEHGYAVIVGVDENQIGRLALSTVAKDVQALYDVLVHPERCAYKPENVKLLKGADSTQNNILDALGWLRDKVKADPAATAIIYYSGHGMVDKATNQYYLVPFNISVLSRIRSDALQAVTLTAEISDIQAPRTLVILDCCHAAGMEVKDIDLSDLEGGQKVFSTPFPIDLPETAEIPEYTAAPGGKNIADLMEGEGRAILNSATGAQSSYVRRDGQMSLFTYHLIEALTGHAPHPDDAKVVYVTDVMSWVTHEVKKSAKSEGVEQTPVMRTSGVFPVAQLIGGKGVMIAKGDIPPAPLDPLPPASTVTTFNQENQTVYGHQANIGTMQGNIGQIGDNVNTGGGAYVRGNVQANRDFIGGNKVVHGGEIGGDRIEGDKISVGNMQNVQGVAIGRHANANVTIQVEDSRFKTESVKQERRFEAAMPKTLKKGQTTELLVMIPRKGSPGLAEYLPKETEFGDVITTGDVSDTDVVLEFPDTNSPVLVYIYVQVSKQDFEVDEPFRGVRLYPNRASSYETFFMTPLRSDTKTPVTIKLYADKERTDVLGSIRLVAIIEPNKNFGLNPELLEVVEYVAARAPVNITWVGNVTNSSGIGIGPNASASVSSVTNFRGNSEANLEELFIPLQVIVAKIAPNLFAKVNSLKTEVGLGSSADDARLAELIQDIVDGGPATKSTLLELFTNPQVVAAAGSVTRYVLKRLK
jgi:hypothetical protein